MKNLTVLFLAIFLFSSLNLSANTSTSTTESGACVWKSWFKYPRNNSSFTEGKDVYVRVDPQRYQDITSMELFVNNKFIRKETRYPFEWCKSNTNADHYLRRLKKGTYKLKVRIKDKCGRYHEIYCTIYVKGRHNTNTGNNGHCNYRATFKYPQNGKTFNAGANVFVKLDVQNYNRIKYAELSINGRFIRKEIRFPYEWAKRGEIRDSLLFNLRPGTYKLKCRVFDKCGKYKDYYRTFYVRANGPGNNPNCKYKSWFKYPKNNGTYRYGDDVYVRVDTEKYQDIKEMQLFVNNKFVRKEANYPFEWCKGSGNSDSYLRNLKRGTYNLKVRVKTKCGKWYEYFCKFYVR